MVAAIGLQRELQGIAVCSSCWSRTYPLFAIAAVVVKGGYEYYIVLLLR